MTRSTPGWRSGFERLHDASPSPSGRGSGWGPARTQAALLDVQNLQTHFGTPDGVVRAVEGLSFHIDPGETVAIVGESGCGKSVTSMSILRLVSTPPGKIAGKVLFQGRDLLEAAGQPPCASCAATTSA